MSQFPQQQMRVPLEYGRDTTGEVRLASFFREVYVWMAVGLAWTAVVSLFVSQTPAVMRVVYANPYMPIVYVLGLLGVSWFTRYAALNISWYAGVGLFMLYATLMGVLCGYVWVLYTGAAIGTAFLITGGIFGSMSLVGFFTKADLSKMGMILGVALMGLIVVSLANIFMKSSAISWAVSYGVVFVTMGLLMYYTQELKNMFLEHGHNQDLASRLAIIGSLTLYVAFMNLLLNILRIIGDRR
jgi:hypothetical protein